MASFLSSSSTKTNPFIFLLPFLIAFPLTLQAQTYHPPIASIDPIAFFQWHLFSLKMPKPKPKRNKGKGKKKPSRGSKHTQTPNPPDNNQGRDPIYNDVASQAGSVTEPPNVTEVTVIQGYEQFALTYRDKSNSSNIATPSNVIADSTDDVGSPNTGESVSFETSFLDLF